MTVTQIVGALGSWELELGPGTPQSVVDQVDFFGHVAIVPGQVDVEAHGQALLKAARYVGVLRGRGKGNARQLAGSGMLFWLGDEDDKGHVLEQELNLVNRTLQQAITAAKPPSVTIGTIYPQADPNARYTGKHVFQSPRKVLESIAEAFGAELRVNGDGSLDVGTPTQLYATTPRQDGQPAPIIARTGASDLDLTAIPGDPTVQEGVYDLTTDVVLIGQTVGTSDEPSEQFAVGRKTATSIAYVDMLGNPVKFTRMISESGETVGTVDQRATLHLNRFNRIARTLSLDSGEYETEGTLAAGDYAYVYDPETGIVDLNRELIFNHERIWPDVARVSGMTWPVTRGHTVAFRTNAGLWLDLTPYVTWETSGLEVTVGDLPKSLTRPTDRIQDRVDAARANQPDTTVPNPPTIASVSTYSVVDGRGNNGAKIRVTLAPPTANTDGSVPVGVRYYVVRWTTVASEEWNYNYAPETTVDLDAMLDLDYKIEAAACDGFNQSDWSAQETIRSSVDTTSPPAPADPVLSSFIGRIRIEYLGVAADGQPMPKDTRQIDVHVGLTSGFTPTTATRVSSITPFAKGVAYADAPYGDIRWVKLVAIDHNLNVSAASAAVSGSTVRVNDGDIVSMNVGKLTAGELTADVTISGRFTTAPFGARREVNAVGFQAFNALEQLTINLDGVSNLLTGILQTALSGRRIKIFTGTDPNNGQTGGRIDIIAPNGVIASIAGFSTGTGEAIGIGIPVGSGPSYASWNSVQIEDDQSIFLLSRTVSAIFGAGGTAGSGAYFVEQTNAANVNTPASRTVRYRILPGGPHTWWGTRNDRGALFLGNRAGDPLDESPVLYLGNAHNFAAGIKYLSASDGTNAQLIACGPDGNGYAMFSGVLNNVSDVSVKDDIVEVSGGLLDELRQAVRPVKYRDKPPKGRTRRKAIDKEGRVFEPAAGRDDDVDRFGLLAHQVPPRMRIQLGDGREGYSVGAGMAYALGGLKELADQVLPELDRIRGELDALKGAAA